MNVKKINSVGIDVGTTTSQAIFSELVLVNSAAASEVPRYDFSRRDISYISPVVFTPRDDGNQIDGLELLHFIDQQYENAHLSIDDVESGAIIITGEASKADNARDTIMEIADQLGDFVVATAGPHLESLIAGHGSGAAEYSKKHGARVLNIDIGGGTSNYSVFVAGQLRDTACLNVGGRLIELDEHGHVHRIHQPAMQVVQRLFDIEPVQSGSIAQRPAGERYSVHYRNTAAAPVHGHGLAQSQLKQVIDTMADLIFQVLNCQAGSLAKGLLMTETLKECAPYDAVFISGGVGECYYREISDPYRYGDVGPALARALHEHSGFARLNVIEPAQTLRATVIGAGMHTLSLSGSTIWLSYDKLPLRNVPVIHATDDTADEAAAIGKSWADGVRMRDLRIDHDCYAICVPSHLPVSYAAVQLCAGAINDFARLRNDNPYPLIVLAAQDFGKALGLELQYTLGDTGLAVIDEVKVREWDYIDIGKGIFNKSVVPLTVKSLAFPS